MFTTDTRVADGLAVMSCEERRDFARLLGIECADSKVITRERIVELIAQASS